MLRIGRKLFSWNSTIAKIAGFSSKKLTSFDYGEKINDEFIRAQRRDGTNEGVTAGTWEADNTTIKMLLDEWTGKSLVAPGFAQRLSLAGTVGLSDVEFDVEFQFFEENMGITGPGVATISLPVCRLVTLKNSSAVGTGASEMELGLRVIEPPQMNGTQLASVLRSFSL